MISAVRLEAAENTENILSACRWQVAPGLTRELNEATKGFVQARIAPLNLHPGLFHALPLENFDIDIHQ